MRHGTPNAYTNGRCRCADCRAAHAAQMRDARARWAEKLADDNSIRHGLCSTYTNYGCRCDACRAGAAAQRRAYRNREEE
jgi:hypothetical protein